MDNSGPARCKILPKPDRYHANKCYFGNAEICTSVLNLLSDGAASKPPDNQQCFDVRLFSVEKEK